jgi:hypothetical protein
MTSRAVVAMGRMMSVLPRATTTAALVVVDAPVLSGVAMASTGIPTPDR